MDESPYTPVEVLDTTALIAKHFSNAAQAAWFESFVRSMVLKEVMRQRGFIE